MITVIDAGARQGYSSTDHLIDDSELAEIIGKKFSSVGKALVAADKRCWMDGRPGVKRRRHPYTWVEVMFADGTKLTKSST